MNKAALTLAGVAVTATVLLAAGRSPAVQAESPAQVSLEPSHLITRDYDGGEFDIRVKVTDLNHRRTIDYDDDRDTVPDRSYESNGLGSFEIELHFDPGVVKVEEAEAGSFASSTGRSVQCFQRRDEPGEFALGCVSLGSGDGPQGSGTLATITLAPLANGASPLALKAGLGGPFGNDIPAEARGTIVLVSGAPSDAPPMDPRLYRDAGPGGSAQTDVIGGGEVGDLDLPEGDSGQARAAGPASGAPGATSGDPTASGNSLDGSSPSAGTGPPEQGMLIWPYLAAGTLAAIGAALLYAGSRMSSRSRSS